MESKRLNISVIVLILIVFTVSVTVYTMRKQSNVQIKIDKNLSLNYFNHGAIKGHFLFSLRTFKPIETLEPQMKSYLISLSDDGKLRFNSASASGWQEKFFKYNFGVLDKKTYYYFAGTFDDAMSNRASVYFMNKSYEDILTITAPQKESDLDGQDIVKSADGHIFYLFERRNISGTIINNEIQERDLDGNIVFSWNTKKVYQETYKDQSLEESEPFQLNSISIDKDKNIIASLKRLHQIIKIEYGTGKILWRIRHEDWIFKNDSLGGYKQQHNVQLLANGNLLMFDIGDRLKRPSRAVEYKFDPAKKVMELVWEFQLQGPLAIRESEGSVQRLSNGNTLIGWGRPQSSIDKLKENIVFTEITPDGKIVRELKTDASVIAYRVYFEEEV
jgi:hypothetical protein